MQQLLIGNLHAKWLMSGLTEAASRKRSHSSPNPEHICHGKGVRMLSVGTSICVCFPNYWCGFLPQKLCQHKVLLRFQMPLRLLKLLGIVPFSENFPTVAWWSFTPLHFLDTSIVSLRVRLPLSLPHVDLHSMKYSFVSCDR